MSGRSPGGHGEHILVVDDTAANLQLLRKLLTEYGYVVHPASDGELALEFVRSNLPDLILLDIRMPGMDGYEVCRRIKADGRTQAVPVILVSILEDERAKVRGFRVGAVDYITKPFQPEEVLARVQLHLRLRELTEHLEQKVGERTEALVRTNRALVDANQRLSQEITERRLVEEALRTSEARYRGIMLALGEGVIVHGPDGRVVECNQEAERILGLSRGELAASTSGDPRWHALREDGSPFPGQDRPAMVTLRTGQPCRGVVMRAQTDAHQDRWILINSEPLIQPGESTPYGAVASFTDISDVHRAQEEFRALADNSPDFIARYDRDGRRLYVNPALARTYGLPAESLVGHAPDHPVTGENGSLTPPSAALLRAKLREVFEHGSSAEVELTHRTPEGLRITHNRLVAECDLDGRVLDVLALGRDLTELKQVERELAEREEWFRLAFDDSLLGMALLSVSSNPHFEYLRVNPAMCGFLGRPEQDLLGLRPAHVLAPDVAADTEAALEGLLSADLTSYRTERPFRDTRGETVWGLLNATLVRDAGGVPLYVLCQVEDITARKRAEYQLVFRALHDDLTGLPNRALLQEHLANALARSRRTGSPLAVLFLDLDDFKSINDSFGHTAGDEFLSKVAVRIRTSVRASDIAARVGGDEFVVVCENLNETTDAAVVASQIQRALAVEIPLRGQSVTAPASIGIALSHGDSTPETLLRDADAAMYAAKRRGGRRWEPADESLHAAAMRILTVEAELRRAMQHQGLLLHYQPLIDLTSGRIMSVEALLRWQHPQQGLVAPEEFVDVAEQRGLITEIGAWALDTACAQAATWYQRYGDAAPCLAVNVSTRQLGDQGMTQNVHHALDTYALPPDRLYLEITESQLLLAGTSAMTDLHTLAEQGIRIAVDDFGTGYAGFDYLRRLPVHELKIDKSFVAGVTTDPTYTAITASIVALGLSLGLTVVAEGIETLQQLHALRDLGCTWGQGWLWHPALPAREMEALLETGVPLRPDHPQAPDHCLVRQRSEPPPVA
jgi:diguanylate cyclase (GGDEF)-like protein/PAS domain S-box-containing protein